MSDRFASQLRKRFLLSALGLASILTFGTFGFWLIGGKEHSLIDSFYMTFITITTIGFGEVIDLSGKSAGRIFTVFTALAGIGLMTYILMNITAFVVEGHINVALRRKRMEQMLKKFRDHFIVCGLDGAGANIIGELYSTGRQVVVVETDLPKVERLSTEYPNLAAIEGDPTDDSVLEKAAVREASGLFAVTMDDNLNLVITLTAKQLNPAIRIVAGCQDVRNTAKMKMAGADSVVSPTFIGGLRMASEMIRPTVVNFLDIMMSRKDQNLRVEEVRVPDEFCSKALSDLGLKKYRHLLLLAVKKNEGWTYNPSRDYVMEKGDILIVMATPEERNELERLFKKG